MPVFDCEADGLFPTKFYVLSYQDGDEVRSLTTHEEMKEWLLSQRELVGHNISSWDIPQLERVLQIKITAKIIDTLYLSWYLYPNRVRHGLEWWGQDLGVEKPEIKDWYSLTLEEYVHRCEEDVKINILLWEKQKAYLRLLYTSPDAESLPIISYLMFKADCAREQERSRWKLDVDWCKAAIEKLESEQAPRIESLKAAMPKVIKRVLKNPPTKPFKKDGTLSVEGFKWQNYLREQGLTNNHSLPIYVVTGEEPPNPDSPVQVKDWLYSLGWEPETFKFEKEADGSERKIPQVKIPQSPDLCPSVLQLAETTPAILELQGLSVVRHRLGILRGFLENMSEDGWVKARIQGLTNTLRFKHTEVVNLPGVNKPYGEEVRGCLVAPEGYELAGTDMAALENKTGDHYVYTLDPKYVEEKNTPGYDPHIEMCVMADLITQDEADFYKWYQTQPH